MDDASMRLWRLADNGVLTEEQAEPLEDLPELALDVLLSVLPDRGVVSSEELADAIEVAQSYLEYGAKWRRP